MESPKIITKAQLLEMVRQEVDFQEKKKLLENRILNIKSELSILTEDAKLNEGLFQNAGRAISGAFSGMKGVGQGIKQNYQKGVDQKSLQYITTDIQQKEQELAQLKKDFQFKTGKPYNAEVAKNATAIGRNQQGVVKATVAEPAIVQQQTKKRVKTASPVTQTKKGAKTAPPVTQTKKGAIRTTTTNKKSKVSQ